MFEYLIAYRFYSGKGIMTGKLCVDSVYRTFEHEITKSDITNLVKELTTTTGYKDLKVLSCSKISLLDLPPQN